MGVFGMAMAAFKKRSHGLAVFERNHGQENVAGESQIEGGIGFAMTMAVFLPRAGVAFVVVAVFHGPRLADSVGGVGFFVGAQAGKEEAGAVISGAQGDCLAATSRAEG